MRSKIDNNIVCYEVGVNQDIRKITQLERVRLYREKLVELGKKKGAEK